MKTLAYIILISLFSLKISSKAQLPYTQPTFVYDSIINIEYGVANNYVGIEDTLIMDIYKPVGDYNCLRPIMILAHGGAWVVESKENSSMQFMARELAKRGWVVANINYRLGTNKASDYSSNFICNSLGIDACTYVADSAEIERANYRAMQDAKGAIRFIKSRHLIDSTDINNVFMAGESAGAFISLSAGFTDNINKKPASCYAIGDAMPPHADLASLTCSDTPNDLSRPDLGDIEGNLNLGAYDASLKGVGSFFGGVFNTELLDGLTNPPAVYLYAQGSDVIVNYNYGPLFERLSSECFSFLGCSDISNYPNAFGGEGIKNYFESILTDTTTYQSDIVYNYSGNDCQADGHAIDNPQLRLQNMVEFFSEKIADSGNNPQTNLCSPLSVNFAKTDKIDVTVKNPFNDKIEIQLKTLVAKCKFRLSSTVGKTIAIGSLKIGLNHINVSDLANGIYLLNVTDEKYSQTIKLIKN